MSPFLLQLVTQAQPQPGPYDVRECRTDDTVTGFAIVDATGWGVVHLPHADPADVDHVAQRRATAHLLAASFEALSALALLLDELSAAVECGKLPALEQLAPAGVYLARRALDQAGGAPVHTPPAAVALVRRILGTPPLVRAIEAAEPAGTPPGERLLEQLAAVTGGPLAVPAGAL